MVLINSIIYRPRLEILVQFKINSKEIEFYFISISEKSSNSKFFSAWCILLFSEANLIFILLSMQHSLVSLKSLENEWRANIQYLKCLIKEITATYAATIYLLTGFHISHKIYFVITAVSKPNIFGWNIFYGY